MAIPLGIISFPPIRDPAPRRRHLDKGCTLAGTPEHLTRALYIPRHNSRTKHIPVYDITSAYTNTLSDLPLGSTHYLAKLCLMRKPNYSTAVNVDVRFLVYFDAEAGEATVDERCLGWNGQQVRMSLPSRHTEDVSFSFVSPEPGPSRNITPSYPLPDTPHKDHLIRHAYFSVSGDAISTSSPSRSSSVSSSCSGSGSGPSAGAGPALQWQIHPEEHGGLRYTLVDVNDANPQTAIHAIYHHAGLEFELPGTYSEGALLLPDSGARRSEADALAVSTALGLLWMVRRDHQTIRKKKSWFGGMSWTRRHRIESFNPNPRESQTLV